MALRVYEDGICSGCGQRVTLAMDPALADFWTTMDPVQDHACAALADAQEAVKESRHPHTLRHIVGMREGWEEALAASRERAPADHQGKPTEGE